MIEQGNKANLTVFVVDQREIKWKQKKNIKKLIYIYVFLVLLSLLSSVSA